MKPNVQRYLELLERRLATLRLLAAGIEESRHAFTEMDLERINSHVTHQESLCSELRFLDVELETLKRQLSTEFQRDVDLTNLKTLQGLLDSESERRMHMLVSGLNTIQADVRRLNRVQAELLRRSRRSINVLINFMSYYRGTYQPPAASTALAMSQPAGK